MENHLLQNGYFVCFGTSKLKDTPTDTALSPAGGRDCLEHEVSNFHVPLYYYDPTYDHESHASNIEKAHILAYRIIFILKEGLNMTEGHPKKTGT